MAEEEMGWVASIKFWSFPLILVFVIAIIVLIMLWMAPAPAI